MAGIDDIKVYQVAREFRQELEAGTYDIMTGLADFPAGACGSASEILQRRLKEAGLGEFDYVCRYRRLPASADPGSQSPTHAWLEKDGLIVDITADQFLGEGRPPVIVTRSSPWHAAWLTDDQLYEDD